ncbi:heparan-alpha-glucosaminide N-acetyltransferase domain-containing protein [Glutamicibacter sp. NPDC087344]|uniref:heparan-alpha-glucosaminide N-acetyltransferase domain-containing protein n=1 Tax=Glutamicibacter sp. NPDC087344 TaxID=3363994 RepID=UPI00381A1331
MSQVSGTPAAAKAVKKPRIIGLDAARGVALMGMIAIHVMPAVNDDYEPTLIWNIASGTASALFALLAGVGLSLSSRRAVNSPVELAGARAALATRAGFILALGLVLALVDMPAYIILAYYGVMFLLAIPFLRLGPTALGFASLGFAVAGSLAAWQLSGSLPHLDYIDPSLSTLFSDPGATLSALLFTGTYPAIPWMTYICAGMAIGKLDLRSKDIQLRIGATGLFLWLSTWAASALLLGPLGGKGELIRSTRRWLSAEDVNDSLIYGLPTEIPLDSLWWQVTLIPHSNMVFEMLNTLGVGMLILVLALIIGERVAWLLHPLAILGSMTLSIYTAHLLFLATGLGTENPTLSFWMQIGSALLLAVLWKNISGLGQGPLEYVTGSLAGKARVKAMNRKTAEAEAPQR